MNSKASLFDASEYPRLSTVLRVLAVTLILAPFVLLRLYRWVMSDIGANGFEPLPALTWGLIAAFVVSLPCASVAVLVYQFIARRPARKAPASITKALPNKAPGMANQPAVVTPMKVP